MACPRLSNEKAMVQPPTPMYYHLPTPVTLFPTLGWLFDVGGREVVSKKKGTTVISEIVFEW